MTRMNFLGLYGRVGVAVAAFALVAGIVAAPVLRWAWRSNPVLSEHAGPPSEFRQMPDVRPIRAG